MTPAVFVDIHMLMLVALLAITVSLCLLTITFVVVTPSRSMKRRLDSQDMQDAFQRELRHIERETARAARLTTQHFLLEDDELTTRRRSS